MYILNGTMKYALDLPPTGPHRNLAYSVFGPVGSGAVFRRTFNLLIFLGTKNLFVLMCCKAVNQSIFDILCK